MAHRQSTAQRRQLAIWNVAGLQMNSWLETSMLSWLPQEIHIPIRIHPLVIDVGKGKNFVIALLATLEYQGIREKKKDWF